MLFPTPDYLSLQLRRLSELRAASDAWLWPGRLTLGSLAMLDGDMGLGKSLVALDVCARVTTGQRMPDGSPGLPPSNVIILTAEDNMEKTVHPRLLNMGADLARVFSLDGVLLRQGQDSIRFPEHGLALRDAVRETQAKLVVIDPIMAFLGTKVAVGIDGSVRRALEPLRFVAEEGLCAVWMLRHLNKKGGQRALYRGGGSVAFNALCRSAWLAARDPAHPERAILAELKNNKDTRQSSLAYEVIATDGLPRVVWHGPVAAAADDLLCRPVGRSPQVRQEARDLLLAFLQPGPRTSLEVAEFVRQHDLATRTVTRVKRELGVRSVRTQFQKQTISYWLLPGQKPPQHLPEQSFTPDEAPLEEAAYRDERDAWLRELDERSGQ